MIDLNYSPEVLVADITTLTTEEWLAYRTLGIGGSDVAAIFNTSPWKTANELYCEKVGINPVEEEEKNWVALEIGHRLEELVVQIYMKKTNLKPYAVRKMFYHPRYPFMLADCDFFVEKEGKIWVVECKTSFSYNHDEWKNGAVPRHYLLQGQHYAAVTNTAGTIFLCLHGNSENTFFIREVPRDLIVEQDLIEMETHFWKEYVEKGISPQLNGDPDLAIDFLKRYTKKRRENTAVLPPVCGSAVLEYLRHQEVKAELAAKSRDIKKKITAASLPVVKALDGAGKGYITVGDMEYEAGYTYKNTTAIPKEKLELLKMEHPDIYDKYTVQRTSESFYIKPKSKVLQKAS